VQLVSALADSPATILQTLAETILDITQCESAGLSLLTSDGKTPDVCGERFYWPAIAGAWNPHLGGGTPRNFGPCGDPAHPRCGIEVVAMSDVTSIVFVVDDDVSVRESLELLIRTAGWRPETFASAREFLSRPRPAAPCCLVLDVTLPDLSGLELQEQLAQRTDMPIIFISGHGDVPMTVQAMKAGAVEFLTKPFKDDVLLDAIRGAIERSRAALREESRCRCCGAAMHLSRPANAR
jgi:FixJ family two-component response regulator